MSSPPLKLGRKTGDAFIRGAKECIEATRKEKGCIAYESHTSINDPNLFVVVERWETREDLNAHGRAPHMKVWREYSAPLKVSPNGDRDHQRRQGRETLECFRAKWEPVRVKKTRQRKKREPGSDAIRTDQALGMFV